MSLIRKLLFPPRCAACRELLPCDGEGGDLVLCRECRGEWEIGKISGCPSCGEPMMDCRCMPGMLSRAGVAGFIKLVAYDPSRHDGAVNSIINNLKRINNKDYFDFFAAQLLPPTRKLLDNYELELSDATVTYCPRRKSAKRDHGFDQSEQLARRMAEFGGARFAPLLRRRPAVLAREQKYLTASERYDNASRAVYLTADAAKSAGDVVILVDDIVTTGATISACATFLRSSGVSLVLAACLAVAGDAEGTLGGTP